MKKILIRATEILKNNFSFRYHCQSRVPKRLEKDYREFMIGIYNRFDEIGLLYSELEKISFNKAIKELELGDYMERLTRIIDKTRGEE